MSTDGISIISIGRFESMPFVYMFCPKQLATALNRGWYSFAADANQSLISHRILPCELDNLVRC